MPQAQLDLHGKVALVTGGGSGIGRGFVLSMAGKGAAVAVVDRNGDAARRVAGEAAALDVPARAYAADVTDAQAMWDTAQDAIANLGQLDFLFANAGVLGPAEYLDVTARDWDLVLDVNIKGIAHTCRAAVDHMMARRQGRIIITASYNGMRAGAHVIPYRVSKAAAIMYTRCLSLVLAPYGITVNAICPGVTLTPMQLDYAQATADERSISLEQYLADRAAKIPMGEFTKIEDVTGLAEFLVSDAARLITGQAIAPDGGVMVSS
jgi:meso-butanediol dehydrogenase/(S,S)-butanediol dehydrogenase/diacetyl reductase